MMTIACQAPPDTPDLSEKLAEKEQELERTRQQLQRYAPAVHLPHSCISPTHVTNLIYPAVQATPVLDAEPESGVASAG